MFLSVSCYAVDPHFKTESDVLSLSLSQYHVVKRFIM